jgi:predicted SAM-dependent methyltransferase
MTEKIWQKEMTLQCFKSYIPGKKYLRLIFKNLIIRKAKNIILGAGNKNYLRWVSTDKNTLDILCRDNFKRYWKPSSRWIFLAEHVWEHLTIEESKIANANCFEFLQLGGRLRIAVPDGLHPDYLYINNVRPGGVGPGAEDHKVIYNYKLLRETLEEAGFKVDLLEYWDENGVFHFRKWDSEDGHICRSKRYDSRNKNGALNYTSLIVDAIKM